MDDLSYRISIRLPEYDYSESGAYFVTICTNHKQHLLGDVVDSEMVLNDVGRMVKNWWYQIREHFKNVDVDEFVVMPNHIHGIIWINDVGAGFPRPSTVIKNSYRQGAGTAPLPKLGQIVAYFKYQSTKQFNVSMGIPGIRFWQRNYYEHVIRSEASLDQIRQYIRNNPVKWNMDPENGRTLT